MSDRHRDNDEEQDRGEQSRDDEGARAIAAAQVQDDGDREQLEARGDERSAGAEDPRRERRVELEVQQREDERIRGDEGHRDDREHAQLQARRGQDTYGQDWLL
jgi:hypothetical protein